jgi:hypothetical protein
LRIGSSLGDSRFDNTLPDITRSGRERIEKEYQLILDRTLMIVTKKLAFGQIVI